MLGPVLPNQLQAALKATRGKADPQLAQKLVKEELDGQE